MSTESYVEIARLLDEESVAERRYFAAAMAPDAPELWRAWRDASEAKWSAQRAACAEFAKARGWRLGEYFDPHELRTRDVKEPRHWPCDWDAWHYSECFWADDKPAAVVCHSPTWDQDLAVAAALGVNREPLPESWYDPRRGCVLYSRAT